MLNEAQTSYMIAKYVAKFPSELVNKNPLIGIEAYGYLCALVDSTDSKELRDRIRKSKEELFTGIRDKLQNALEVNPYDKL